jgi:hypothetical protein
MQLTEVSDKKTAREFLEANVEINKHDPNYIRPLDKDINEVFDPKKNKAFRHGEAIRWILKDENGNLIGRIAALANKKYKNKGDDVPVGGIGFFDCINNQNAADMLFDVAKHWLMQRGMQAWMARSISVSETGGGGLLVEGFEPPVYCLNYNPLYYKNCLKAMASKIFQPALLCFKSLGAFAGKILYTSCGHCRRPGFLSMPYSKITTGKIRERFYGCLQ